FHVTGVQTCALPISDIYWDKIQKYISNKIKFTDIPKYPEVRRDLALLIDSKVAFEAIYKVAKQTEKKLLKDINLFDVYEGKNLRSEERRVGKECRSN